MLDMDNLYAAYFINSKIYVKVERILFNETCW